ncbi:MAG TPA: hypothetical protein EYN79_10030 [Planctomycetes bacterium]|nr:hypothetical protein [Planctomycetota bacterium]HIN80407.1 hypothetical protein [Planctomycetota bacterium]
MSTRFSPLPFLTLIIMAAITAATGVAIADGESGPVPPITPCDPAVEKAVALPGDEVSNDNPTADEHRQFPAATALEMILRFQEISEIPAVLDSKQFSSWSTRRAYLPTRSIWLPSAIESLSLAMIETILEVNGISLQEVQVGDGSEAVVVHFSNESRLHYSRSSRRRSVPPRPSLPPSRESTPAPPSPQEKKTGLQLERIPLSGNIPGKEVLKVLNTLIDKPRAIICTVGDLQTGKEVLVVRGRPRQVKEVIEVARFIEASLKE